MNSGNQRWVWGQMAKSHEWHTHPCIHDQKSTHQLYTHTRTYAKKPYTYISKKLHAHPFIHEDLHTHPFTREGLYAHPHIHSSCSCATVNRHVCATINRHAHLFVREQKLTCTPMQTKDYKKQNPAFEHIYVTHINTTHIDIKLRCKCLYETHIDISYTHITAGNSHAPASVLDYMHTHTHAYMMILRAHPT